MRIGTALGSATTGTVIGYCVSVVHITLLRCLLYKVLVF